MPTDNLPARSLLSAFRAPLWAVVPALMLAGVLALFPQIDLVVSGLFYDAGYGGFFIGRSEVLGALGMVTSLAAPFFVLGCLVWWLVVQRLRPHAPRISERMMTYLLLAFLIGPVLIVSLGFKEHWPRMRPAEVTQFGGEAPFTAFYQPQGVCVDDCSFPSGHSSRGFYFMAVAIAAYGFGWPQRHRILAAALVFGSFTALLRIIEGKHFLSDVTLAGVIVTYVSWVLFRIIFRKQISPH